MYLQRVEILPMSNIQQQCGQKITVFVFFSPQEIFYFCILSQALIFHVVLVTFAL